jgi:uncharacterized protein (DUF1684 family)
MYIGAKIFIYLKIKPVFLISGLVIASVIVIYFQQAGTSPENYANQIMQERAEKDEFMRSNPESPFKNLPEECKGLNYYAPNLRYRIKASLIPIDDKKVVNLPTSDNKENEYLEYGYATFRLKGEECKLLILEITDQGPSHGTLFLAFADSTSARETYGAGRYLELKKVPGMTSFVLDFNKAYNPYCAYNDNFSCPIPPKENFLKVAIPAGEKSYH